MIPKQLRGLVRLAILVFSTTQVLAAWLLLRLQNGGPLTPRQRAEWLHRAGDLIVRRLRIRFEIAGTPPARGLVVSNHLSYLDILLYAAAMPCVFVSKIEVRNWPFFGLAAVCGGTVFLDRTSSASTAAAGRQMERLLAADIPVLLFAEGTSTDGSLVLPFHSSLFEPAIRAQAPVTAAAIQYLDGADYTEKDVCYYGDIVFAPHLLQTLGFRQLAGRVAFSSRSAHYPGRKAAAAAARSEVVSLREQWKSAQHPVTASSEIGWR